jgi:hypothetical protein
LNKIELVRTGKEVAMTCSKAYPDIAWRDWGNPQKTSVKIDGNQAEIWTIYSPNTSLECYNCANLPSVFK